MKKSTKLPEKIVKTMSNQNPSSVKSIKITKKRNINTNFTFKNKNTLTKYYF